MRVAGIPLGVGQNIFDASKTVLLMPFSNVSGLNDISQYARTFNVVSAPAIESDVNSSHGYSARFTNDLINIPHDTALELGSTDFTIEFFLRQTSLTANRGILGVRNATTNQSSFTVRTYTGNIIAFEYVNQSGTAVITVSTGTNALVAGVRYHIAIVRQGVSLKIYINGILDTSHTIATPSFFDGTTLFGIGSFYSDSYASGLPDSNIDNLRIRTEAVYTENFTPPTVPFTY